MKLKLITGALLAVALIAGLWWRFHRVTPAVNSVVELAEPTPTSLTKPIPMNAPRLVTITNKQVVIQPVASALIVADWSAVQVIVDPYSSYEKRLGAINGLSKHLTAGDWNMLKKFLLKQDGLDRSQLGQVIKNRLLDVLCALNPPPTELGKVLTQLYQDPKQNEVIRDYAVQHLAAYYEQMANWPKSNQTLDSVQTVLWEAVKEPSGSLGGTALLALNRLSREYPANFKQKKIATTALQLAENPIANELTHITAFQVCAELGNTNALPVALKAAENGETVIVRLSAIGALGLLGGTDQIPYLKSLLAGDEDRLKPAAQHALAQIEARNQTASR